MSAEIYTKADGAVPSDSRVGSSTMSEASGATSHDRAEVLNNISGDTFDDKDGIVIPWLAFPPFDMPEADIVLHSSDGVDFRVVSWIVRDASPIFADTLNTPQASSDSPDPAVDATVPSTPMCDTPPLRRGSLHATNLINTPQLPIIDLPESSTILEPLLRLCYPNPPTLSFASFDEAKPLLRAAHKYQMKYATHALENAILPHVVSNPVSVYIFATQHGLADTMRAAAQAWLSETSPWVFHPGLDYISAGSYNRLITYREDCKRALTTWLAPTWGPRETSYKRPCPQWTWYTCSICVPGMPVLARYGIGRRFTESGLDPNRRAEWFSKFKDRVDAALTVTPVIGVLEDPGLTVDVLERACECATCRVVVHSQMREFVGLLVDAAKEKLSKVN